MILALAPGILTLAGTILALVPGILTFAPRVLALAGTILALVVWFVVSQFFVAVQTNDFVVHDKIGRV